MRYIAFLVLCTPAAFGQETVHNICEILSALDAYRNQIIRVQGKISAGAGVFLAAPNCPTRFRAGGIEFDSILSLEWPDNPVVRARHEVVPFRTDNPSLQLLQRAMSRWDRKRDDLLVTVEGLLVTRNPPLALSHPKNSDQPAGFGHLGAAPAEVIVKRVVEIQAVRRTEK